MRAEILWSLKVTQSHYSYHSSEQTGQLFSAMFPDSEIAKSFSCGQTKCAYICAYGLAPHFKSRLTNKLKSGNEDYVLLFDESLNRMTQSKQCDFHVRFWNGDQVQTQFFDTEFMGHARADDLKLAFEKCTEALPKKNMLQISMDGPNVNWSFYKKVEQSLAEEYGLNLLNLGSCGQSM
ncbi:hypothetical protein QQF64_034369 [Cirrhinus molitorella]|uniref:Uncharacterized protein n=1 Tax=Cirrhinus molitorella TaxID=172907 RepID=A0ABR3L3V5_9TELE